jgi:hypothetical protein
MASRQHTAIVLVAFQVRRKNIDGLVVVVSTLHTHRNEERSSFSSERKKMVACTYIHEFVIALVP